MSEVFVILYIAEMVAQWIYTSPHKQAVWCLYALLDRAQFLQVINYNVYDDISDILLLDGSEDSWQIC